MKKKKHEDDIEVEVDDVVPSDEEGEVHSTDTVKRLRKELEECRKEKQEFLEGWQRAKADFINARKAEEQKRSEVVKYAKEGVLVELLSVVDTFEMAFADKAAWEKVDENWRRGIEHIYSNLISILADHSLSAFSPLGEPFDPQSQESVALVEVTDQKDDHKVVEVIQKGYKLNGKLVRPAKVKVGHFTGN
jgi:molecular chaperone GrpE